MTRRFTAATLPTLLLTFSAAMPVRAADAVNIAQTILPNQNTSKPGKSCSIRAKHGCQNKDRSPAKTENILTAPSTAPASPQPTLTCRHPNPSAPIKCNKS